MKNFVTLEKAQQFVKKLYPNLSKIENPFKSQLKRSSLSIALNLAEGFAKTGADRKRFYKIAFASAKETGDTAPIPPVFGPVSPSLILL